MAQELDVNTVLVVTIPGATVGGFPIVPPPGVTFANGRVVAANTENVHKLKIGDEIIVDVATLGELVTFPLLKAIVTSTQWTLVSIA